MRWPVACAAALSLLAAAEGGARQYGFGAPLLYRAAASGYEMVPNQQISRLGHTTSVNGIGTRGPEVSLMPEGDRFRVLVLGDSVANGGTMLDDAETFPAIASARLNAQGCRSEMIDAATGGWSIHDEIAWVHEHGLFGARTVVWTINDLDLDQPRTDGTVLDSNPSFPSRAPSTALSEISTRYVLPRLGLGTGDTDHGSVGGSALDTRRFVDVLDAVTAFKQELDQRGVTLIVLYHQSLQPLPADRAVARTQFMAVLANLSVPVLETGLSTLADPASHYIDTIHPNAQGHAAIGSLLAARLDEACPAQARSHI